MSAIAWMVAHAPVGASAPRAPGTQALDRVLPMLNRTWRSRYEIAHTLGLDQRHIGRTLERGVVLGVVESMERGWQKARLYRRAA